ncbi:MAG: purine-binding chemotaxis protein CheW [Chloroflexi bacterium]|nr:purine-binding chemotaxis protein CheW [Chloroflexota bacterium]MBV9899426.1 purine-binding chemotaxis protein CheW [Chloroflexota bacterium]
MSDVELDEVLRRRAEQLAQLPVTENTGDEVEVLACQMGDERYAVETRHLRAVQWATGVTPVPCTPAFVVGIVSVRGEIVTLLDLATMIGLRGVPLLAADKPVPVLLLGLAGMRAGLVVDEVLGVERLKLDALRVAPSGREFVRGIGPRDTVVLDVEALLGSGRFTVSDE